MGDHSSSFQAIVDRFEAMHSDQANVPSTTPNIQSQISQPPLPPSSPQPHVTETLQTQSIEDFEREEDAKEAQLTKQVQTKGLPMLPASLPKKPPVGRPVIEPMRKKPKKFTDAEELAAEERAVNEMGNGNWVGKLQIYRDARPVPGGGTGFDWTEGVEVNPIARFTCTLVIHETMNRFGYETFGTTSRVVTFSNKKTAKQWAAKKAVDWLMANEYMPRDGSVQHRSIPLPMPKKVRTKIPPPPPRVKVALPPLISAPPKTGPAVGDPAAAGAASPGGAPSNCAGRIPDLCRRLGVAIPTYIITPLVPRSPLCDGYADFGGDPVVDGKVGEVTNVFGKKNAKEEIARVVYSFLKDIERQRMEQFGLVEVDVDVDVDSIADVDVGSDVEEIGVENGYKNGTDGKSDENGDGNEGENDDRNGDGDDEDRKRKRESASSDGTPEARSKSVKLDA